MELMALFDENPNRFDMTAFTTSLPDIIATIRTQISQLAGEATLWKLDTQMKDSFADHFPLDILHVTDLPCDVYHHIKLLPGAPISVSCTYGCPRKYWSGWKTLIDQHVAADQIQPSSSPYASLSFIIPKADPTVLPQWVNNHWHLNRLTVPNNYPLPRINDILADCVKGKIWGKIDMMNSFFQTLVHPDDIKYTATLTPFGLWEWVVMPMGMWNSLATHQRRITLMLKDLIGKICHVYLDNIIIWSNTLEEHKQNVSLVLEALWKAYLYCSLKKSILFMMEIDFLGHHISARGIEANQSKVLRILNWPAPKSTEHVWQFLGLVWYIAFFLLTLVEYTTILTPLTRKECNAAFPTWTCNHQAAFDNIKWLVIRRDCLTTIDHENSGDNNIYVTCDVSKRQTDAVLSFGPSWESAQPVAFESRQMNSAEHNYPVHEQEMLVIMRALKKWWVDLLGSHIHIHTDHKTLQNFDFQRNLSQQQARWMEYLSQYEYTITYINGDHNTIADGYWGYQTLWTTTHL